MPGPTTLAEALRELMDSRFDRTERAFLAWVADRVEARGMTTTAIIEIAEALDGPPAPPDPADWWKLGPPDDRED